MKVLITTPVFSKFSQLPMRILEHAELEIQWIKAATQEQIKRTIVDADAVLCGSEPIRRDIIDLAPRLKVISKHGVGLDTIDVEYAESRGIKVFNTAEISSDAVADMAFGLALAAARGFTLAHKSLLNNEWPVLPGLSVWGRTMGIIGLSAAGKAMARRAKGFHMDIIAYDPLWDDAFAERYEIKRVCLDELYSQADFISLHCNLSEETRNMIDMAALKKMQPSAVLINTARGGLVNEDDLYIALKEGMIAAAGLDVFVEEPAAASPLLTLDNVVATPHCGAHTDCAITKTSIVAAQNIVNNLNQFSRAVPQIAIA